MEKKLIEYDRCFLKEGVDGIIGVDDVGLGCVFGSIVTCAVILDLTFEGTELEKIHVADSKSLTRSERERAIPRLEKFIKAKAFGIVDATELNSLKLSGMNLDVMAKLARERAVKKIYQTNYVVLVDGIRDSYVINKTLVDTVKVKKITGTDETPSASIAVASVFAKVYRDSLMKMYHKMFPEYNLEEGMGYGTPEHLRAVKKYGITPLHRFWYKNIREYAK